MKDAYGVAENGSRVSITVPSKTLKFVRSFEVEEGRETRITLDFDLDRSLKENTQGWKLTPVVGKTTAVVVDDASSGEEKSKPGDSEELDELD